MIFIYHFKRNHFFHPNKFKYFCRLFFKVQKEIIVIIGGPGTGKTTIIDGLIAKGHCCYPEISEVTAEAKKQGIDQLFLEKPLPRVTLKAEKNSFKTHTKSHMKLYLLTRNSDVLAYMHYIGDSYPASLIVLVANTPTQNFHFTTLGRNLH
jgi:predicted ATPase